MIGALPSSYALSKVRLRWDAEATAATISSLNERDLLFARFAAAAESSTQHGFERLSCALQNALSECSSSECQPLSKCLNELEKYLPRWRLEEENHVRFFNCLLDALNVRDKARSDAAGEMNPQKQSFQVEQPIPESQSWDTTLLFLFFSEIVSMVWYRTFFRIVEDARVKRALFHLHFDEVQHFLMFRSSCLQISNTRAEFFANARRVSSYFAYSLRTKQADAQLRSHASKDLNWWEHSVTECYVDRERVFQQIRGIQKHCLREIEFAAKGKCA